MPFGKKKLEFCDLHENKFGTTLLLNLPLGVRDGMRDGVLYGTAAGLNIPGFPIAAKTGTAELGVSKERVNSWVTGFFPYENPRYAFALVMEKGSRHNTIGGVFVMRQFFEWMLKNAPEYANPRIVKENTTRL